MSTKQQEQGLPGIVRSQEDLAKFPARKIRLPLLENKEDNVVEVGINGIMTLIKRGESVEVAAPIAQILEQGGYL